MNLKKYLFVGAALMSVSFFAACSDDENEPQNPPVEEPDEPNGDDPEGPVSLEDQWNNTCKSGRPMEQYQYGDLAC